MPVCVAGSCLSLALVITRWQSCGTVAKPYFPQIIWLLSKFTSQNPLGVVHNQIGLGQFAKGANDWHLFATHKKKKNQKHVCH